MKRKVSELSPEEFKQVFPIVLKEHNTKYKDWYKSEEQSILSAVKAEDVARISHIGSSTVKGLTAKPTIDILLEMDGTCTVTKLLEDLKTIGYGVEIFSQHDNPARWLLGKGFSCDGYAEKVFLLHVRYLGNWDELYFRDYLTAHSDVPA